MSGRMLRRLTLFAMTLIMLCLVYIVLPALGETLSNSVASQINQGEEQIGEKKNIAEELFGWIDKGVKYKLGNYAILTLQVDNIEKKILINNNLNKDATIYCYNPDGSTRWSSDGESIVEFYDEKEVLKLAVPENYGYIADYDKYFTNNEEVKFCGWVSLPDYVDYIEALSDEQKEEIKRRCKREQTIEEVAETLLMIDPDIKGWHTKKAMEIKVSGKIPSDRKDEQLWDADIGGTLITIKDGMEKMIFLEMYQTRGGEYRYRELFTKTPFSNIEMTEIDDPISRVLNIENIENVERGTYYFADIARECNIAKPLTRFIREAKVKNDVWVYYDIGKLITAYDQLDEKYKIDFSWYNPGYTYVLENGNATIASFIGPEKEIIIPAFMDGYPVTRIGLAAFQGCNNLTSIVLPDSVTQIEERAFSGCRNLKSISIPSGVTAIAGGAFSECNALSSISLPAAITCIGEQAFSNCGSLQSIVIPDGVASIGSAAFSGCGSLTDVVIPSGVTVIENRTFSNCGSLRSITLPASITSIGYDVFYECKSLGVIALPNTIKKIGDRAFAGCDNLVLRVSKSGAALKYAKKNSINYLVSPSAKNVGILKDGLDITGSIQFIGLDGDAKTISLSALILPEGAFQEVTWKSSSPSIAKVDESGLVTGLKTGTVTVTATAMDGSRKTAKITVKVTMTRP